MVKTTHFARSTLRDRDRAKRQREGWCHRQISGFLGEFTRLNDRSGNTRVPFLTSTITRGTP